MAMLTSGEYDLTEKSCVRDRKSMLFVKLTDSAQRALNDFFKNQDKCKVPIIEFNKDDGRIYIPTSNSKGSPESDKCTAQFKFNVISNVAMQGQQGRFECIQHKRGSKHLIKFGPLTHRLRIHANEDVFETTKNRMAAIEQEQRKNCTREIDWNTTSGINRKVRIDRSAKSTTAGAPPIVETSSSLPKTVNATPAAFLAARNNCSKVNTQTSAAAVETFESRLNRNAPIARTAIAAAPLNAAAKAKSNTRAKQANSTPKSATNPALMKRPLKERIIHLLAIRPHKKLELFAALRREGLRESDKSHLMHTLVSVSTLRDNTYQLLRHVWNDIQEDWPFYTEQERQQMKRNKPQNLTPPSSDSGISVGSNQSPNSSSSFSGDKSPSCQYKRPGYYHGVDGIQTKKPRISHYSRPTSKPALNSEENVQISPSRITNGFDEAIAKSGLFNTAVKNPPIRANYRGKKSELDSKPALAKNVPDNIGARNNVRNAATRDLNIVPHSDVYNSEVTNARVKDERPTNKCEADSSTDAQSRYSNKTRTGYSNSYSNPATALQVDPSSSVSPLPLKMSQMKLPDDGVSESSQRLPVVDYDRVYTTITNPEQRRKYKDDFVSLFDEYQKLDEEVTAVTNIFKRLGDTLKRYPNGSTDWKRVESEIKMKYTKLKEEGFDFKKQRLAHLYEVLSHIKHLVNEFDVEISHS